MEYKQARDLDLLDAYNNTLARLGKRASYMKREEIFAEVCRHPAKQFYISEQEAIEKVSRLRRGKSLNIKSPLRIEMYVEISRRARHEEALYPGKRLSTIVAEIVHTPAPCFYILPGTAEILYNNTVKQLSRRITPHINQQRA